MTTIHAATRGGYRRIVLDEAGAAASAETSAAADATATDDAIPAAATPETVEGALDGHALECVAVHPDRPERVFVGTFESGLWRSTDGGRSFERVGTDGGRRAESDRGADDDHDRIEPDAVTAVAVAPGAPDEVWVGTEPSRVYRSTDGGTTWTERDGLTALDSASEWSFPPRPHTHHVRWLEPAPRRADGETDGASGADRWYVAVEAGALVRTHDGGATWLDRVPDGPLDTHTVATHPDVPERAWVAAGDGFAVTTDGGATWDYPETGLDRTYCWSVAVDAADSERVLVSAARSAREAHTADRAETYVYRRDGDGPWERLDDAGLPVGTGVTRPVVARGTVGGEFYALSNRGLWRTADGGDSWREVSVAWPDGVREQTARGLVVVDGA